MTSLYEWLLQSGHELPKDRISTDRMGYTSSNDDGFNAANQAWLEALKQIEAPSLDKWKKLVELTPRGSEFENDPENIFKYLKERMDKLHSTLKENVLLKSQIEAPGEVSTCCQYSVKVEGKTTKYYVCKKCGKPCDTKEAPNLVELEEEAVHVEINRK